MVASELMGMCIMALAAFGQSICMTLCSLVTELQIPYYRLAGAAELVMAGALFVAILTKGELSKVQVHEWKWIVLRGAFGSGTALFAWAAVAEGAPLGDASALSSVNVVVAALLGRVFLAEPLNFFHICALISSVAGAVLVSNPEAITGVSHSTGSTPWIGYALALGSGLSSGGLFIASRKSQGISPLVMSFSVLLQEGLSLWVVSSFGFVKDGPLEPLIAHPAMGVAWFMSFLLLFTGCVFTISLGSQLCPAAASSTIFTSVSMSLGYVAQSIVHHQRPEALTELGAVLMLLAVAFIAAGRWWQSKATSAREGEEALDAALLPADREEEADDVLAADGKTASLARFIAMEFSGLARPSKSIRQRRTLASAVEALHLTLA